MDCHHGREQATPGRRGQPTGDAAGVARLPIQDGQAARAAPPGTSGAGAGPSACGEAGTSRGPATAPQRRAPHKRRHADLTSRDGAGEGREDSQDDAGARFGATANVAHANGPDLSWLAAEQAGSRPEAVFSQEEQERYRRQREARASAAAAWYNDVPDDGDEAVFDGVENAFFDDLMDATAAADDDGDDDDGDDDGDDGEEEALRASGAPGMSSLQPRSQRHMQQQAHGQHATQGDRVRTQPQQDALQPPPKRQRVGTERDTGSAAEAADAAADVSACPLQAPHDEPGSPDPQQAHRLAALAEEVKACVGILRAAKSGVTPAPTPCPLLQLDQEQDQDEANGNDGSNVPAPSSGGEDASRDQPGSTVGAAAGGCSGREGQRSGSGRRSSAGRGGGAGLWSATAVYRSQGLELGAIPDAVTLKRAAHFLSETCKLGDRELDVVLAAGVVEAIAPLLNRQHPSLLVGAGVSHAAAGSCSDGAGRGREAGGTPAVAAAAADAGRGGGHGVAAGAVGMGGGAAGAAPAAQGTVSAAQAALQAETDKECCFILASLAGRHELQMRIANSGVLPGLVRLLAQHRIAATTRVRPGSGGVARRAADAITNMCHENQAIKEMVRTCGGLSALAALLCALDVKVARAAAGALRTLVFRHDANKIALIEAGALPWLVALLGSQDSTLHFQACGVVGNLVHSSAPLKRQVLAEGALQPCIALLSSPCPDAKREAALLLGQFATAQLPEGGDARSCIVQRGAARQLVEMLAHGDLSQQEMSSFALGRLAHGADSQAGIAAAGAIPHLLDVIEHTEALVLAAAAKQQHGGEGNGGVVINHHHHNNNGHAEDEDEDDEEAYLAQLGSAQHNAAFTLYGLAECNDNLPAMVAAGAVQRLDALQSVQAPASRDCVQKTISRLAGKLGALGGEGATPPARAAAQAVGNAPPPVLSASTAERLLLQCSLLLRSGDRVERERAALALAHLAPASVLPSVFITRHGAEVLLTLLADVCASPVLRAEAASALVKVAESADLEGGAALTNGNVANVGGSAAGASPGVGDAAARGSAGSAAAVAGGSLVSVSPSGSHQLLSHRSVYLGEQYVNNDTLSDVTFLVEGRRFYAHRIALLASSEAFRAMFVGAYRERANSEIEIPNITYEVFEAMIRYCYTGHASVSPDIAFELLQASDQYLLSGLKSLCEDALARSLEVGSVVALLDAAAQHCAHRLATRAALFVLRQWGEVLDAYDAPSHAALLACAVVPCLRYALGLKAGPGPGMGAGLRLKLRRQPTEAAQQEEQEQKGAAGSE